MSDDRSRVLRPFFRNEQYDKMEDDIDDVIGKYANKGISRAEAVGCLEFIKNRIMNDD